MTVEAAADERRARLGAAASPLKIENEIAGGAPVSLGFGVMFPNLRKPEHQLPPGPGTVAALQLLAEAMIDRRPESGSGIDNRDSATLKSALTYLGQFLDHDITNQGDSTLEAMKALATPTGPHAPLANLFDLLANARTGFLDLDSVYEPQAPGQEPPPRRGEEMLVGNVASGGPGGPVTGKTRDNDLPRRAANRTAQARIGDPRNDENLIVAQLHTALLRSHNALVKGGKDFSAARKTLRRIFQHVVLHDFARQICGAAIIDDVVANGRRFWNPEPGRASDLPIEFSAAAYRFGHSMIRQRYDYNENFGIGGEVTNGERTTLVELFRFTELSGAPASPVVSLKALPENWVIQWERVLGTEPARRIDPLLADPLAALPSAKDDPPLMSRLAARNLLRGFLFGLPTGQAVADAMGVTPLAGQALLDALPAVNDLAGVVSAGGFHEKTPLWFYVLAEAGSAAGDGGEHLGPVGGRIVAETLHALIEASSDNILTTPANAEEALTLAGLLKLSGNL